MGFCELIKPVELRFMGLGGTETIFLVVVPDGLEGRKRKKSHENIDNRGYRTIGERLPAGPGAEV